MIEAHTPTGKTTIDEALLDRMQQRADPLADRTVAAIFDPLHNDNVIRSAAEALENDAPLWRRIRIANALLSQWESNAHLVDWSPDFSKLSGSIDPTPVEAQVIADAMRAFLNEAHRLPDWAHSEHIAIAERVFIEQGVLSCLLLFCASLPQCYVLPDLSDVLHAAGQLEQHTEHRIRSTAAMIFPVMLKGGLTSPDGAGVAQILKVRLIHAMIRHLILRGTPEDAVTALERFETIATPPLALGNAPHDLYRTLYAHGWNIARDGLPCNQEELAYTLLTFHYVFVQGMRDLGVALAAEEERAYLHCWNVVGHVLGIESELMQDDMQSASNVFALMQARGRADSNKRPGATDPRPKLGAALVSSMERVLPFAALRGAPSLLTEKLCGAQLASEIGIAGRATASQRTWFRVLFGGARVIDTVVRWVWKDFSLSKLLSRVIGYHLLTQLLLDQTRPLRLPDRLLDEIDATVQGWSDDEKAPSWINRIEDRFTIHGNWLHSARNRGK